MLAVVGFLDLRGGGWSRRCARRIESVIRSAYMITVPLTLRAARPIVWISERSRAQIAFLVGVEDGDQRDLGQVEPFAQQVDADQHVELAAAQVADDLDAFERLDVGVQVAHAHAELPVVVGEILGHLLGERRHQDALVAADADADLSSRSSTCCPAGRTMISGSIRPVGRMSCSTTTPPAFCSS